MYGTFKNPGAKRPGTCKHDTAVHGESGKGTAEPEECDADANHRPYLDKGRSGSNYQPAAGVQQLSGLVPLDCQLRGTDIRILP